MELTLKYGLNPNQEHARLVTDGTPGPLTVVNGTPSYINVLDALRGWQLVRELRAATGKAAAASYKHVSPAGAAVAEPVDAAFRKAFLYDPGELSPAAAAYARARSSDRVASFGDLIAVSETVDLSLAELIKPEVSDGIIAPGYDPDAMELLSSKKGGKYVMFQIDRSYTPPEVESRIEFGQRLEQSYNDAPITPEMLREHIVTRNTALPDDVLQTLLVATITLKHTQSNSVAVGYRGQAVGIGAGQQSRIACTRLACEKLERWMLMQHPRTLELELDPQLPRSERINLREAFVRYDQLVEPERANLRQRVGQAIEPLSDDEKRQWFERFEGLSLSSDAFFPFRDNLDRAAYSGVGYVAQAGGSRRDEDVIAAADEHGMLMCLTGMRLFLH